jgi:uncharacterized protein YdgA (DUF945 family)
MKKIFIGILGLVALPLAALGGASFWFGLQAEKYYQDALKRASKNSWGLTGKHYDRGWMSSTAETLIRYQNLPVELSATHRISHGPWAFDRLLAGEIDLTPVQARIASRVTLTVKEAPAAMQQVLAQLPALAVDTTLAFSGDGVARLEIPALKKSAPDGTTLEWRGLQGDIHFDPEWKKIKANLQAPGLRLFQTQNSQDLLTLTKLNIRTDVQEGVAGFYLGEGSVSLERAGFGHPAFPAVLQGLSFSSQTRAAGDNLNVTIKYKVNAIEVANEAHGPGEFTLELRNLDAVTLRKLEGEFDALSRQNLPKEQANLILTGKLLEYAALLAKKAPELEITKLNFTSGGSELSGRAKLVVDGSQSNIAENPMLLLTAVRGDLELSLPGAMLKPLLAPLIRADIEAQRQRGKLSEAEYAQLTPEVFARIVDQVLPLYLPQHPFTRMLVKEGARYRLTATLKQGQVLVNNEPWRLDGPTPVANARALPAARPAAQSPAG